LVTRGCLFGSRFRVQGSGFWVLGSGFRVKRFRVLGSKVQGSRKDFNPSTLNSER